MRPDPPAVPSGSTRIPYCPGNTDKKRSGSSAPAQTHEPPDSDTLRPIEHLRAVSCGIGPGPVAPADPRRRRRYRRTHPHRETGGLKSPIGSPLPIYCRMKQQGRSPPRLIPAEMSLCQFCANGLCIVLVCRGRWQRVSKGKCLKWLMLMPFDPDF